MSSIRREEYAAMELRVKKLEAEALAKDRLIAQLRAGLEEEAAEHQEYIESNAGSME